jgi:hypothetical protein
MHALKAEFELSNNLHVLARASMGESGRFEIAREGVIRTIARIYENRGNELNKCLKTNDITFFNAANPAPFARNLSAIEPQKDQTTPDFAKTRSGLAIPMRCCDSDKKSASVPSQKSVKKVFLMRDHSLEPRQGRYRVAQGVSPGLEVPHPAFGTPLPLGGRGDGGEGGLSQPTAYAMGYRLPPVSRRAEFLNELLTQDTRQPRDSHRCRADLVSGLFILSTDWGVGILWTENLARVNSVCVTLRSCGTRVPASGGTVFI